MVLGSSKVLHAIQNIIQGHYGLAYVSAHCTTTRTLHFLYIPIIYRCVRPNVVEHTIVNYHHHH